MFASNLRLGCCEAFCTVASEVRDGKGSSIYEIIATSVDSVKCPNDRSDQML